MSKTCFSLHPFSNKMNLNDIKITGNIARTSNVLAISYSLNGPLSKVIIPSSSLTPARRSRLWEETCFEFFLAPLDSDQYWEFNLSPDGHWNVYHFQSYRQGMKEESAFTSVPFAIHNQSDYFMLALEIDLDNIIKANQPLKAAISAVVLLHDKDQTFWSLIHSGPKPDFHSRDSFIIDL